MIRNDIVERVPAILRRVVFFLFLLTLGWIVYTVLGSGINKYSWLFSVFVLALTAALLFSRCRIRELFFRLSYNLNP